MPTTPLYKPSGRAGEYAGSYACNLYVGCPHGCVYCYEKKRHRRFHPGGDFTKVHRRPGIVEAIAAQIQREGITGQVIHFCFTCDPYPIGANTDDTRAAILAVKQSGNHVQLLTKNGPAATRDFDLLDKNDWFGVSLSCNNALAPQFEPGAAPPSTRLDALKAAKAAGISTWISCEPVIEPNAIYTLIQSVDYIDKFKIGKMNHYKAPTFGLLSIDWQDFGFRCKSLCERHGHYFTLKADLLREMYGKEAAAE